MAKAKKTKTPTVEEMVSTMVQIVESIGDLKAGVQIKKRDIVKNIPVDKENVTVLNGMTKKQLQQTYDSLLELKSRSAN